MPDTAAGKPKVIRPVPAVSRAIAVLRYLAKTDQPQGVVQLAKALEIIPSTCLHILRVLDSEGLVSFDPVTKKYQLAAGVLALANDFVSKNSLVQVVRPHLEEVSRRHRCTAVAVEPSGNNHFIVIATTDLNPGLSVRVTVGTRVPALLSATGRCLAAYGNWSKDELRKKFAGLRWQNPPTFETWYQEVEHTREVGYAVDRDNYILGFTIVAAPILQDPEASRGLIGAIVALGLSGQLVDDRLESLALDLQRATKRVTAQLGHASSSSR